MPKTWTDPEVFLEHNGVSIYYIYADDDMDQGVVRTYWYGYSPACTDTGIDSFDIRDLPNWKNGRDHAEVLREAIDYGWITKEGLKLPKWEWY